MMTTKKQYRELENSLNIKRQELLYKIGGYIFVIKDDFILLKLGSSEMGFGGVLPLENALKSLEKDL